MEMVNLNDYLTRALREAVADERQEEEPAVDDQAASAPLSAAVQQARKEIEAEYALEHPVRCQACGETVDHLKAVRLLRTRVNFTSTLPRRGRVIVCPLCHAMVPAELTNF
jgi:hypothetical protein